MTITYRGHVVTVQTEADLWAWVAAVGKAS